MQTNGGYLRQLTLKPLMYLELLIAAILPVVAILIVGVVGTQQIPGASVNVFLLVFFICVIAVFFGELAILLLLQNAMKKQISEVTVTCQEYMAGNKQSRMSVRGDDELTLLSRTLNMLLDRQQNLSQEEYAALKNETQQITNQIQRLVAELSPVVDGNLRVRAAVVPGNVGVVADVCNSLIEELVQLAKWTRFASDQVISSSRNLLDRSIELAQTTETQMVRLSQTTESVEKLVAFIQRMSSTLQLSVDITQESFNYLQQHRNYLMRNDKTVILRSDSSFSQANTLLDRLLANMQRQTRLLTDVLQTTQGNTSLAESVIGDLYTFAQQIQQASTGVLKTAERISSLATLAERWRNSVASFQLPDDTQDAFALEEGASEESWLSSPTPTSAIRSLRVK